MGTRLPVVVRGAVRLFPITGPFLPAWVVESTSGGVLMSVRRRRHSALAVFALVVVMVGARAVPAGAFLSALDPAGWAVVAQMAAVISQAVAIKRQVENVRNQARSSFFGKLAPLTGKLMTIRRQIIDVRSKASLDVIIPDTSVGMLPEDLPAFNKPPEDCVGNTFVDNCLLPERSLDTAQFRTVTESFRASLGNPYGIAVPMGPATQAAYNDSYDQLNRYVEQLHTYMEAELDAAETERARDRALVETIMSTVEDWSGCQTAPDAGGTLDTAVDDRVPCTTNGGLGQADSGGSSGVAGTDGLQQELAVQLEALEEYQDGDASQTQIDSLQTKMLIQLARLEAVRAQLQARGLERNQERAALGEAARRRDVALLGQYLLCRASEGSASYWIPADINGDPTAGECKVTVDRSAAALDELRRLDLVTIW